MYSFQAVFDNVVLVPGPGHIVINMTRLLLSLLWEPFIKEFAKMLGFHTQKAQDVVKGELIIIDQGFCCLSV